MKKESNFTKLKKGQWLTIILLGLSGQLAWAVEDSWFNTFVFDTITPDPSVISWMVGASAVTATVTTLLIGTLSDRIGKRKAFILVGYLTWGLLTVLFPLTSYIQSLSLAIVAVVVVDSVLTFFGATAYDAAFNAWVTDISDDTNRGMIQGVLEALPFLAMILSLVVSGIVIDRFGYYVFFYILGGIIIVSGIIGSARMKDAEHIAKLSKERKGSFFKQLLSVFNVKIVTSNARLFLVFLSLTIANIGTQIYMPYQMIYLTNYLGFEYTQISIILGVSLMIAIGFSIPFGRLADRFSRSAMSKYGPIIGFVGALAISLSDSLVTIFASSILLLIGMVAINVVLNAWIRDLTPKETAGQFQGIRMIFFVAIPMIIGPWIGSALIETFGIPTVLNDASGFIPTPILFQVSAVITLLSLIPIIYIDYKKRKQSI